MRKYTSIITLLALFLSMNTVLYAESLSPAAVKSVFDETKTAYIKKCIKDFKSSNPLICRCLAEKAVSYLDGNALAKCQNDATATKCISSIVADAVTRASTKENMDICTVEASDKMKTMAPTSTSLVPSAGAPTITPPASNVPNLPTNSTPPPLPGANSPGTTNTMPPN